VVGLEVNVQKSKYRFSLITRMQDKIIKVGNKSLKNLAKVKYIRTRIAYQNYIHKEIMSRLNLGDACYHSVQGLFSSHLLSKNLKIKIHKTIILPGVLHKCEICLSY